MNNKNANRKIGWQDRENTRSLRLLDYVQRQVMDMDAYQIIMICLAAVTLLLKLIEMYNRK